MVLANPVIIVPGITANYLEDRYPISPDTIWSVLSRDFERSSLHPDDTKYEAKEPALVRPGQLFEIVYSELIEELRYNLRDSEREPVPVFPFSYDWRQPLDATVAALEAFADEVRGRTRLLRHYDAAGYGKNGEPGNVDFVGHSMGGLIIAGLAKQTSGKGIGRVVSLGTPFGGSFESIIKIIAGTSGLGTSAPSSREREAARITPALYHLLPESHLDVYSIGGALIDLFNPATWQPTILETIAQFIDERGLIRPVDSNDRAVELLRAMLEKARNYKNNIKVSSIAEIGLSSNQWLAIAGVDETTRVRMGVQLDSSGKQEFVFNGGEDRQNSWGKKTDGTLPSPDQRFKTGDGTVPLLAAVPAFLDRSNVVCVRSADFGYWEIKDRILAENQGLHGFLPTMDMIHRLIVRFFRDKSDTRKNTWGYPLPGVASADWNPPLNGGLFDRS